MSGTGSGTGTDTTFSGMAAAAGAITDGSSAVLTSTLIASTSSPATARSDTDGGDLGSDGLSSLLPPNLAPGQGDVVRVAKSTEVHELSDDVPQIFRDEQEVLAPLPDLIDRPGSPAVDFPPVAVECVRPFRPGSPAVDLPPVAVECVRPFEFGELDGISTAPRQGDASRKSRDPSPSLLSIPLITPFNLIPRRSNSREPNPNANLPFQEEPHAMHSTPMSPFLSRPSQVPLTNGDLEEQDKPSDDAGVVVEFKGEDQEAPGQGDDGPSFELPDLSKCQYVGPDLDTHPPELNKSPDEKQGPEQGYASSSFEPLPIQFDDTTRDSKSTPGSGISGLMRAGATMVLNGLQSAVSSMPELHTSGTMGVTPFTDEPAVEPYSPGEDYIEELSSELLGHRSVSNTPSESQPKQPTPRREDAQAPGQGDEASEPARKVPHLSLPPLPPTGVEGRKPASGQSTPKRSERPGQGTAEWLTGDHIGERPSNRRRTESGTDGGDVLAITKEQLQKIKDDAYSAGESKAKMYHTHLIKENEQLVQRLHKENQELQEEVEKKTKIAEAATREAQEVLGQKQRRVLPC